MRENKFRGFNYIHDKWVYGYLIGKDMIVNVEYRDGERINNHYSVFTETVGEFSGLYDENKDEIYEGHIIFDDSGDDTYEVRFDEGKFVAILDGNVCIDLCEVAGRCSIIGNIPYDIELIKATE